MGFRVTRLSAGVLRSDGSFGPEFDHMCLMVELEERWLADVGFGDSFCEPLRLDDPSEQRQGGRVYRVAHDGCQGTMLFEDEALGRDEYRFSLQARRLADYEEMCRYHQTSPKSSFTQRSVCSIATPGGRTTLRGLRLITTGAGGRRERLLTETERQRVLRTVFGIEPGELTAPQDV
jgi:N-hydroxyarylamine O-acetyltransferase